MRQALFVCVCVFLSTTVQAQWVKDVTTATATQTDNKLVITTGTTVGQGHTLIGFGLHKNTGDAIVSVSDSQGNTYIVDDTDSADFDDVDAKFAVFSAYLTTGLGSGDTVTIQWTNSAFSYFAGQLVEYSGLTSSSWTDKVAHASTFAAQGTGITSGATATTTQANELVVGFLRVRASTETLSAGSGFSMRSQFSFAGPNWVMGMEDKIVSATGAQTATGSWVTGSQSEGAFVVTYKLAAVASVPSRGLLGVGK